MIFLPDLQPGGLDLDLDLDFDFDFNLIIL